MPGQEAINGEWCEELSEGSNTPSAIPQAPFSLNSYFYIIWQLRKTKIIQLKIKMIEQIYTVPI